MSRSGGNIDSIVAASSRPIDAPDMTSAANDRTENDGDVGRTFSGKQWPLDAPITPLGVQGKMLWLLDSLNQMTQTDTRLSKGDLVLYTGDEAWLAGEFPQYGKPKGDMPADIVGFNQATAASALILACRRKGIFNPTGKVFGRGANRSPDLDGRLMLHMGNAVLIAGSPDHRGKAGKMTRHRPGKVEEYFFPAQDKLPPPADEPSTLADAEKLLAEFRKWFFVEPKIAPLLLLGMVGQMFVCGALEWRSHMWLAGPTAAGKSSLQKLIRAIHEHWCLFTEDASEAAIRQILGDDTLPVMIDEAEADDNPERQRAVINLAKKSSSGAKIIRGGADHKGTEFTGQSCFLMSSVITSLTKGEDHNRFAVLDMLAVPEMPKDSTGRVQLWEAPDLNAWKATGRRMHRRMIDQWPRFAATYATFKREIASHGVQGRWQDTFGTLLACAHMLMYDAAPLDLAGHEDGVGMEKSWVLTILPMLMRGRIEARTDVDRCLAFLLSSPLPGAHGQAPEAIGQWIVRAMTQSVDDDGNPITNEAARQRLRMYGLKLLIPNTTKNGFGGSDEPLPTANGWEEGYLAVAAATCRPLNDLFRGTEWFDGKWHQSLVKIEGAMKGGKTRFIPGTNPDNCIAIPLKAIRGTED